MRDVTVDITAEAEEDTFTVTCDGKLKEQCGRYFVKAYDKADIFYFEYAENEKRLKAHRRGDMKYDMTLCEGEKSACEISTPYGFIRTEYTTTEIALKKQERGFTLEAKYIENTNGKRAITVRVRYKDK